MTGIIVSIVVVFGLLIVLAIEVIKSERASGIRQKQESSGGKKNGKG